MEDSSVKIIGGSLIVAALSTATWLVFFDIISYWTGVGRSRITALDVSKLTFVRDDHLRLGGPGVHFNRVKYYKTPDDGEIAIFQTGEDSQHNIFIRGQHRIFLAEGHKQITTYEPFVVWIFLVKRSAVLLIVFFMILAVAGFALRLIGQRPGNRTEAIAGMPGQE